jgi:hypothetical protein
MTPWRWLADRFTTTPPPAGVPIVEPEVELGPFDGPLDALPANRTAVYRTFGNPGVGKTDKLWERAHMVGAKDLPGTWNKGWNKLYVHRLAEPYLREALRRCVVLGCIDEIRSLGAFSFRHQRHDPGRPLSYHSWGIAIDINAADNGGWYAKDPPDPWSPAWRAHYPQGLSSAVVRAFESCGWRWGGRWKGYVDPMHLELTA